MLTQVSLVILAMIPKSKQTGYFEKTFNGEWNLGWNISFAINR